MYPHSKGASVGDLLGRVFYMRIDALKGMLGGTPMITSCGGVITSAIAKHDSRIAVYSAINIVVA